MQHSLLAIEAACPCKRLPCRTGAADFAHEANSQWSTRGQDRSWGGLVAKCQQGRLQVLQDVAHLEAS